ncbi:deoxyribonuclease [Neptunitalea chrysea]|uniref:Deoxyribonuclease n=1 Tax=Neptunitalea chrysea TaxID=1647581 RepID=A0A9W6B4I3_9FLAO|nr:endonuclease/exonuclease/phosphatase family protein [Neptunitalea chrysea]GLB51177.1 deoxyribonuclease [Neptunitalea chrysea]
MASILETPPLDILENLEALKRDLDTNVPPKKLDKNLLIASWNIRGFGNLTREWMSTENDSPKRDLHSVLCIAEILKRFDVIAIQELKSNLRAFRDTLKVLGPNWSFILTDVTKGNAGNGERMAYLFDTRRVNLSGLACELVVPDEWLNAGANENTLKSQFARTPYAVSFKSGKQTFILVTLHILYGDNAAARIPELEVIAKWLAKWSGNVNAYSQNLIALGDFNIDKRGDLLHQTFIKEGLYIPEKLQDESVLRSIFDKSRYYDQIAWFKDSQFGANLTMEYTNAGSFDFLTSALVNRDLTKRSKSFMISDHYPLWCEFKV